jgi:hypothetical protein
MTADASAASSGRPVIRVLVAGMNIFLQASGITGRSRKPLLAEKGGGDERA